MMRVFIIILTLFLNRGQNANGIQNVDWRQMDGSR